MKKSALPSHALSRRPATGVCGCMKRQCAQLSAPSLTCRPQLEMLQYFARTTCSVDATLTSARWNQIRFPDYNPASRAVASERRPYHWGLPLASQDVSIIAKISAANLSRTRLSEPIETSASSEATKKNAPQRKVWLTAHE